MSTCPLRKEGAEEGRRPKQPQASQLCSRNSSSTICRGFFYTDLESLSTSKMQSESRFTFLNLSLSTEENLGAATEQGKGQQQTAPRPIYHILQECKFLRVLKALKKGGSKNISEIRQEQNRRIQMNSKNRKDDWRQYKNIGIGKATIKQLRKKMARGWTNNKKQSVARKVTVDTRQHSDGNPLTVNYSETAIRCRQHNGQLKELLFSTYVNYNFLLPTCHF